MNSVIKKKTTKTKQTKKLKKTLTLMVKVYSSYWGAEKYSQMQTDK